MLNDKPSLLIITEPFPNINNRFLGTFVVNQINELAKLYNIVVITTQSPTISNPFVKRIQKKILNDNLRVYHIKYYPLWLVGLKFLKVISSNTLCYLNKKFTSKKIIKLAINIHREFKFDLVHGHEVYIGDESSKVGKILNIPSIFTLHGLYNYHVKCFGKKTVDLSMDNLNHFNEFISVSKIAADSYLNNGLEIPKIEIIPNGISYSYNQKPTNKITSFTKNKTVLLSIGFFAPEKRINQSIKALHHLKLLGYHDIVLLIVGLGKLEINLKKLVNKLNLQDSVLFTGQIFPDKMSSIYSVTNILVHPSIIDSFSMVCLEAMSHGIPIICTKNIGIVEFIRPGIDSIVIDPDNQIQLQDAIINLINDQNLSSSIGRQAKKTTQTLSIDKQIQKLKVIYEQYFI